MPTFLPDRNEYARLLAEKDDARRAVLKNQRDIEKDFRTGATQLVEVARYYPLQTLAGVTVAAAGSVFILGSLRARRLAFKGLRIVLRGIVPFL